MNAPVYDFLGIGIGPFNLGLACLTRPIKPLQGLFLDRRSGFDWHPGMMLDQVSLQTPFLSDLVTLADPTSPLSFLNYLKKQGRLYAFYIKEDFFILREEYNQYCQWAASQCSNLRFYHQVKHVHYQAETGHYLVQGRDHKLGQDFSHATKRLVLGTGTRPMLPKCCQGLHAPLVHSSDYLHQRNQIKQRRSITLIGSGQSAAEIYYDLLQDADRLGYALYWVTRSPRFFPLEYTKLTLEMTSPEYIDYFHALPAARREQLLSRQAGLYKGINQHLIDDIYRLLYAKRLTGRLHTDLTTCTELVSCNYFPDQQQFKLGLHQFEQDLHYELDTEALILATGYAAQQNDFLAPIANRIRRDERGRFAVARNYSIDASGKEIFVQNAELHTHGLSAPDLGMGAYRNASIIREMLGREYYPIEKRIAFQTFNAPLPAITGPMPNPVDLT